MNGIGEPALRHQATPRRVDRALRTASAGRAACASANTPRSRTAAAVRAARRAAATLRSGPHRRAHAAGRRRRPRRASANHPSAMAALARRAPRRRKSAGCRSSAASLNRRNSALSHAKSPATASTSSTHSSGAALESRERLGRQRQRPVQRKIGRSFARGRAHGLQQMRLARSGCTPQPQRRRSARLSAATTSRVGSRPEARRIPRPPATGLRGRAASRAPVSPARRRSDRGCGASGSTPAARKSAHSRCR